MHRQCLKSYAPKFHKKCVVFHSCDTWTSEINEAKSKINHFENTLHLLYFAQSEHQQPQCMNIENPHPLSTVHMQGMYPQQ